MDHFLMSLLLLIPDAALLFFGLMFADEAPRAWCGADYREYSYTGGVLCALSALAGVVIAGIAYYYLRSLWMLVPALSMIPGGLMVRMIVREYKTTHGGWYYKPSLS